MTSTIRRAGSALVAAAALAAAAPAALAQWGAARVDHWLVYQDNFGDTARWQYKPKIFLPYKFGSGWTFTQRIDVPMFVTDAPGPDNEGRWPSRVVDGHIALSCRAGGRRHCRARRRGLEGPG